MSSNDACEVPLVEQLRSIPKGYRTCRAIQWSDDGRETGHQLIPVGYMMHRAADEIERLQAASPNSEALRLLREAKMHLDARPEDTGLDVFRQIVNGFLARADKNAAGQELRSTTVSPVSDSPTPAPAAPSEAPTPRTGERPHSIFEWMLHSARGPQGDGMSKRRQRKPAKRPTAKERVVIRQGVAEYARRFRLIGDAARRLGERRGK